MANYWFTSGAPGYLVKLLQEQNYTFDKKNIEELDGAIVSADADITYQLERFPLISLLLQTGYLTIKEYLREQSIFTVTYPNKEAKKALSQLIDVTCKNIGEWIVVDESANHSA